jgi:hypothetical protein
MIEKLGAKLIAIIVLAAVVLGLAVFAVGQWRRAHTEAAERRVESAQGEALSNLPDGNTVGDWIAFGDAQTGKLDVANGRTRDAIGIVERCEARDTAAVKKAKRGFIGRVFGG